MGHFVLPVDRIALVVAIRLLLALAYIVDLIFQWTLARWGEKWGIRGREDWASSPVLALIVALISVALAPASNALSRVREHEADRFGWS
jgi:STE24 endopeptidase